MRSHIVLYLFVPAFWACTAPETLLQTGRYDAAIHSYARKSPKTENIQGMEEAYRLAQERDFRAVDALLAAPVPEWPEVQVYYSRIRQRQSDMLARQPIRSRDGYTPRFDWLEDIDSLELDSREKAAAQVYERALPYVEQGRNGDKFAARTAWNLLNQIQTSYFPAYRDVLPLMAEARLDGTTYVLVEYGGPWFFHRDQMERDINLDGYLNRGAWQEFHTSRAAGITYDYAAEIAFSFFNIGMENRMENTQTFQKDIEVRVEIKYDSTGAVIERTPVYEQVSGTITETRITKDASVQLYFTLRNLSNGQTVDWDNAILSTAFDQTWVSTSGDSRAFDTMPICTGIGFPSAPSDWSMVSDLAGDARRRILWLLDAYSGNR